MIAILVCSQMAENQMVNKINRLRTASRNIAPYHYIKGMFRLFLDEIITIGLLEIPKQILRILLEFPVSTKDRQKQANIYQIKYLKDISSKFPYHEKRINQINHEVSFNTSINSILQKFVCQFPVIGVINWILIYITDVHHKLSYLQIFVINNSPQFLCLVYVIALSSCIGAYYFE